MSWSFSFIIIFLHYYPKLSGVNINSSFSSFMLSYVPTLSNVKNAFRLIGESNLFY